MMTSRKNRLVLMMAMMTMPMMTMMRTMTMPLQRSPCAQIVLKHACPLSS